MDYMIMATIAEGLQWLIAVIDFSPLMVQRTAHANTVMVQNISRVRYNSTEANNLSTQTQLKTR